MSWEVEFRKQDVPYFYNEATGKFFLDKSDPRDWVMMSKDDYFRFCQKEELRNQIKEQLRQEYAEKMRLQEAEFQRKLELLKKQEAVMLQQREEAQRAEDHRLWRERMSRAVDDWKILVGVEELFDESVYTVTRTKIRHTEVFLPGDFCDLFESLDDVVLDTAVTAANVFEPILVQDGNFVIFFGSFGVSVPCTNNATESKMGDHAELVKIDTAQVERDADTRQTRYEKIDPMHITSYLGAMLWFDQAMFSAACVMNTIYCLLVIGIFASQYRGKYRGRLYGSVTTWDPGGCACVLDCWSCGIVCAEICLGLTLELPLSQTSERD